jgi:DNA polymerase III epsilon subunit-like protein
MNLNQLVFLDTETTGNDIKKDRLAQVCYRFGDAVFNEYFKPPVPMSVKAMSVTHITNKMLVNKPAFKGSQMEADLKDLLKDKILVAHNAKFDIGILEAEDIFTSKFICTLRVARFLDPNNLIPEYGLQFLRYFLDLEVVGDAHNAEGDVNVLYGVFERLFSKMKETEGSEEKALEKMIEISKVPTIFNKFNFGKYKDKTIKEVLIDDRRYLEWLLNSKLENEQNDEDWIYTLKHYLNK